MITYLITNWETVLSIYIIGFFGWCGFMSFRLEGVDREYFISAALWPALLVHVLSTKLRLLIAPPKGRR